MAGRAKRQVPAIECQVPGTGSRQSPRKVTSQSDFDATPVGVGDLRLGQFWMMDYTKNSVRADSPCTPK